MNHEIYIFGSLTRGDVTLSSDVDVLVIPIEDGDGGAYPPGWSLYSRKTISEYFDHGRLFAWHLYLESKCIYSKSEQPWISSIGPPNPYLSAQEDIIQLREILLYSLDELRQKTPSFVYEVGLIYTALRDIAMSASWALNGKPDFSRLAPLNLPIKCPLGEDIYQLAIEARHSSTRGNSMPSLDFGAVDTILEAPLDVWVTSVLEAI